jgi:hypothetical protein
MARSTKPCNSAIGSTLAPSKAGSEQRNERLKSGEPRPSWSYYEPKSDPGVSGERFSDDSGVAEAGSINSGDFSTT